MRCSTPRPNRSHTVVRVSTCSSASPACCARYLFVHRVGAFESYVRVVHPQEDRAGVRAGVRAVVALLQKNNLAIELDVRELA